MPPPAQPAQIYNPAVALEFFRTAGKPEAFDKGATIFAESQKANRLLLQREKIYLLLQGEVSIVAGGAEIGSVRAGEIFGEVTAISQSPRTASAVAKSPCNAIGLDDKQFLAGLEKKPEFALMLMGVMIERLRRTYAKLAKSGVQAAAATARESSVFDKKLLAELARLLADIPETRFAQNKIIFMEGQPGVLMYVVLEGRVGVILGGKLLERIGAGGVVGEMALIDQAPRTANAVAETDCVMLGVNRQAFLALMQAKPAFGASLLRAVAERLRAAIELRRAG